jgi:hypothetical protein
VDLLAIVTAAAFLSAQKPPATRRLEALKIEMADLSRNGTVPPLSPSSSTTMIATVI